MGNQNCAYQPGCGISNAGAYGSALNNVNGGVYATEYSNTGISVWWFQRNNIPSDLAQNSTKANPSAWGKPAAYFPIGGGDCPSSHFYDLDVCFYFLFILFLSLFCFFFHSFFVCFLFPYFFSFPSIRSSSTSPFVVTGLELSLEAIAPERDLAIVMCRITLLLLSKLIG